MRNTCHDYTYCRSHLVESNLWFLLSVSVFYLFTSWRWSRATENVYHLSSWFYVLSWPNKIASNYSKYILPIFTYPQNDYYDLLWLVFRVIYYFFILDQFLSGFFLYFFSCFPSDHLYFPVFVVTTAFVFSVLLIIQCHFNFKYKSPTIAFYRRFSSLCVFWFS